MRGILVSFIFKINFQGNFGMAIKVKRHIGKVFEFNFEGFVFYGLCVFYDETFGYHLTFTSDQGAIKRNSCQSHLNDPLSLGAFAPLDALIRRKQARCVDKMLGFKPFLPTLRGGGGERPDGTLKSFMIYDAAGWHPIDRNDPILPSLSECRILGIGSIKGFLESGITREEVFKLPQPVY
jgi:hypothetical protein